MRIVLLAAACCSVLGSAGPAGAQERWQAFRDAVTGVAGASVCPIDGDPAEDRFCFRVGCRAGQPLGFGIDASGQYLALEMAVAVAVDGELAGTLTFVLTDGDDRWSDMGAPLEEPHLALLDRLRAGSGATLAFRTLLERHEVEMGLGGSSAAIGAALEACPLPDFAALRASASAAAGLEAEASPEPGAEAAADGAPEPADAAPAEAPDAPLDSDAGAGD